MVGLTDIGKCVSTCRLGGTDWAGHFPCWRVVAVGEGGVAVAMMMVMWMMVMLMMKVMRYVMGVVMRMMMGDEGDGGGWDREGGFPRLVPELSGLKGITLPGMVALGMMVFSHP